jgi:3-phosphoshikimate 1-carboxyvinyltransferase
LAGDGSVVENLSRSDDIDATLKGVKALDLAELQLDGNTLRATRKSGELQAFRTVDCRESGSTLRFLLPLAALDGRRTIFTGQSRLLQRPLGVYEKIFSNAGMSFVQEADRVTVEGRLQSGVYVLPGNVSSQFVSGLLFALPLLEGDSEIHLSTPLESGPYVDLTLDVMRRFGAELEVGVGWYKARGGKGYRPASYKVEADYSQAAFFLIAAALGRDVGVAGLNPESRQGDRAILSILRKIGAEPVWRDGVVRLASTSCLSAVTVDAREIPDLAPPVAALCCFCEGTSKILNAGRLRLKESDRLRALRVELNKLGASVEEGEDFLSITGAKRLRGGNADAWGDHRIAMALAAASIRCETPIQLTGWQCVNKSYPDFWQSFCQGKR